MSGMNRATFGAKAQAALTTETISIKEFGDVTISKATVARHKQVAKKIREDEQDGAVWIAIGAVIDSETGAFMFEMNDESKAFFQSLPVSVVKEIAEASNRLNGFEAVAAKNA
jgi:hypothetical protein